MKTTRYPDFYQANVDNLVQRPAAVKTQEKLLPAMILGGYFFYLWNPPIEWVFNLRWFMLLVLAILTFLMQGKRLDLKAAKVFWSIQGLALVGALLAFLRAPNVDSAATGMFSMVVAFITMLLFLTTFASQRARSIILIVLIVVAALWVIEIHRRLSVYGYFIPSSFSTEQDNKNQVALILALAATALLAFAVLWKPSSTYPRTRARIFRLTALVSCVFMYYTASLTYSRSELLTALVGIMTVIGLKTIQTKGTRKIFLIGSGLILIGIIVMIAIPFVSKAAPFWNLVLAPFLNLGDPGSFFSRRGLFLKGLLIISENPFIGVGVGNTYGIYGNYPSPGYIHNTYLTLWAEMGILGAFSVILFIILFLRIFKSQFSKATLVDQIWLLLFIPFLFTLIFIDVSILPMLAILSGIYYGAYIKSHPSKHYTHLT